jgi:alkylation response protein AidB-like acyl-CoA dehydrogenase
VTFENVAVGADAVIGEVDNGIAALVERVVDEGIAAPVGRGDRCDEGA